MITDNSTAAAVGLTDRGELKISKRGDVNIIDFDNLAVDALPGKLIRARR